MDTRCLYWARETNGYFRNGVEDISFFIKKGLWIIILCLYLRKREPQWCHDFDYVSTHRWWHVPCHLWKATLPSNQLAKQKVAFHSPCSDFSKDMFLIKDGMNTHKKQKTQTRKTSRKFWLWFKKQQPKKKKNPKQNLCWERKVMMRLDRRAHVPLLRVRR